MKRAILETAHLITAALRQKADAPNGGLELQQCATTGRSLGVTRDDHPPSPFRVVIAGMWGNRAQYRIVRVALLRASIQGFPIDWHQRRVEEQSYHQVRIGNEGLAERHEISAPICDGPVCAWLIKAIVGYDESPEQAFEVFVVERRNRDAGRIAFNNMEIGEALSGQLFWLSAMSF
jgi:hypothetical protein